MYGLPVTRTFEACAVGWYTPRKRSPRDRFVRERVLPTSFDHLEYRREYLTFHSTRIRREYPRLSRPDQTTNLIVSRVRYVALTYYSRQQRYYAIISSFTHLHFFFFFTTESRHRNRVFLQCARLLRHLCFFASRLSFLIRLKIVSEEQYSFATHNYR